MLFLLSLLSSYNGILVLHFNKNAWKVIELKTFASSSSICVAIIVSLFCAVNSVGALCEAIRWLFNCSAVCFTRSSWINGSYLISNDKINSVYRESKVLAEDKPPFKSPWNLLAPGIYSIRYRAQNTVYILHLTFTKCCSFNLCDNEMRKCLNTRNYGLALPSMPKTED